MEPTEPLPELSRLAELLTPEQLDLLIKKLSRVKASKTLRPSPAQIVIGLNRVRNALSWNREIAQSVASGRLCEFEISPPHEKGKLSEPFLFVYLSKTKLEAQESRTVENFKPDTLL